MRRRIYFLIVITVFISSCSALQPVSTIMNSDIRCYKYVFIGQTNSITSTSGASVKGQYYSTSQSVNPRDVIGGVLSKEGFIILPELKPELASQTLAVNYGESGTRNTGLGSYAIEVTIQFISSDTNMLISSCTAEGRGSTEAEDIREAITRCLEPIIAKDK